MYHRDRHRLLVILSCASFLALARGASAETFTLTNTVVTAQDAIPYQQTIHDFVAGQVEKLKSDNSEIQKVARDSLASKAEQIGASASFLDEYGGALDELLLPLAGDKRVRVRLNAAIVNGRVAAKANNARQVDSTLAFMKDSTAPVALWGLKAAKFEIPALLQVPTDTRKDMLTGAVLPTVKAHGVGAVVEEAYWALTLDTTGNLKGVKADTLKVVLPLILEMFEYRLGLYHQQAPEDPLAEIQACLFLTKSTVWPVESSQQQAQALKLMTALVQGAMQVAPSAQSPVKEDLVNLIRQTGKCFEVVGQITDRAKLRSAAAGISEMNEATTPEEAQKRVEALNAALKDASLTGSDSGVSAPAPPGTTTVSN